MTPKRPKAPVLVTTRPARPATGFEARERETLPGAGYRPHFQPFAEWSSAFECWQSGQHARAA